MLRGLWRVIALLWRGAEATPKTSNTAPVKLFEFAAGVFENRIEMKAIPACHFICLSIKALPNRHRQEGPRQ